MKSAWIQDPFLIRVLIYALARLIPDHRKREAIQSIEIRICIRLIRSHVLEIY